MEFTKMMLLSQPYMHDVDACKAWGEFQSLYQANYSDMVIIATNYKTTPQEMKEHKGCWKHYR